MLPFIYKEFELISFQSGSIVFCFRLTAKNSLLMDHIFESYVIQDYVNFSIEVFKKKASVYIRVSQNGQNLIMYNLFFIKNQWFSLVH